MKEAICLALLVIPAVLLIVGALVLMFGFRLSKNKVEEMERKIKNCICKKESVVQNQNETVRQALFAR